MSKSGLAIELSKLAVFDNTRQKLEQYPTDSEVAASVLWDAYMHGDIKGRTIADLGAGTGILGIGALILGAKKVYFVEKDADVLAILKQNIEKVRKVIEIRSRYEIINCDVTEFSKSIDVVLQNPPFGTKGKHSDILFLEKAFNTAPIIYSLHKTSTVEYIKEMAKKNHFAITNIYDFSFPLKRTRDYHKRDIHRIMVSCFRFVKPKPI